MAACSSQQAPAEQPQETDTQETAPPEQETEKQESDEPVEEEAVEEAAILSGALSVKALQPKQVEENPYMAKVMPTFTMTDITPTQRMKFSPLVFIRKLTSLTKRPM